MDDESDNDQRALVGLVVGIAVTIAITVALTSGVVATMSARPGAIASPAVAAPPAAAPAPAAPAPAPAAPAPAPVATAPATAPASAIAKVYFASGQKDLPTDAGATLAPVVDAAKAASERRLVVSGFHDRTGNPEVNAELAKQRAFAVRDALVAAGVAESRIELRKPVQTEGDGSDREARRVEVSVE